MTLSTKQTSALISFCSEVSWALQGPDINISLILSFISRIAFGGVRKANEAFLNERDGQGYVCCWWHIRW